MTFAAVCAGVALGQHRLHPLVGRGRLQGGELALEQLLAGRSGRAASSSRRSSTSLLTMQEDHGRSRPSGEQLVPVGALERRAGHHAGLVRPRSARPSTRRPRAARAARSSSVSGMPAASWRRWLPGGRCRRPRTASGAVPASSAPTVVLPLPATPATIRITDITIRVHVALIPRDQCARPVRRRTSPRVPGDLGVVLLASARWEPTGEDPRVYNVGASSGPPAGLSIHKHVPGPCPVQGFSAGASSG